VSVIYNAVMCIAKRVVPPSQAPVNLLAVKKVTVVHWPDVLNERPRDQHCGTADVVHLPFDLGDIW
jgi:hypothetical protein